SVVGPLDEPGGTPRIDPASSVDLEAPVDDGRGRKLSWRRVSANTEGLIDLTAVGSGDPGHAAAVYAYTPVVSPLAQKGRLVFDTPAAVAVWLNGKPVTLPGGSAAHDEPRTATV